LELQVFVELDFVAFADAVDETVFCDPEQAGFVALVFEVFAFVDLFVFDLVQTRLRDC